MLKYDAKAKEKIIRCNRENGIGNTLIFGNTELQNEEEILEKYVSEVIKEKIEMIIP